MGHNKRRPASQAASKEMYFMTLPELLVCNACSWLCLFKPHCAVMMDHEFDIFRMIATIQSACHRGLFNRTSSGQILDCGLAVYSAVVAQAHSPRVR